MSRTSRGAAFGAVSEANFGVVGLAGSETPPPAGTFIGDPVLSLDGLTLVYSQYGGAILDAVRIAQRADLNSPWSSTRVLGTTQLQTSGGNRRRPSGLSSDLRTLFFWDEVAGEERAVWRDSKTADFAQVADVGPQMFAQPTLSCKRLYYSAQGATSIDLFFADAN